MLRVGIVGCGFMGRQHARAYGAVAAHLQATQPEAVPVLAAVCDADPERAASVAAETGAVAYTDVSAMLAAERLDLVDVVTPDFAHRAPTVAALSAGCHVFVEKPIAQTTADAAAMIETADRAGRTLAVNFNRRFARPYALAHEYQQQGRLGRLSYGLFRVALPASPRVTTPHELVYDSLIHLLDLARWYGGEVAQVSCALSGLAETGHGPAYHDAAITLRYAEGGVATVVGSWHGSRLHGIEYAEVQGSGGRARVDNVVSRFTFEPNDDGMAAVWEPRPFGDATRLLRFYPTTVEQHLSALLPALADGRPAPVSGEDGLAALRLVLAAIASFERGRPVAPSEIPDGRVGPTVVTPGAPGLRVACQTYTWQMAGTRWFGQLAAVLDAIAGPAIAGVEITWQMLGPWLDRPEEARREFEARGLALAAVAMSPTSGWTDPATIPDEESLVGRVLRFLSAFPSPRLGLGGGRLVGDTRYPEDVVPPPSAADPARTAAFDRMLERYRVTALRAAGAGVAVHVHPTSTADSLIRVRADYDRLATGLSDLLAGETLQLGPGTAHIVRGDEAPAAFVARYAPSIGHIHLKDAGARGGPFLPLGSGDAGISDVVGRLRAAGYTGWVVAEEESESAADEPAEAVRAARAYLRTLGL